MHCLLLPQLHVSGDRTSASRALSRPPCPQSLELSNTNADKSWAKLIANIVSGRAGQHGGGGGPGAQDAIKAG